MDAIQLAPRPDLDALRVRLRETGRVHIPGILSEDPAKSVWSALANETEWSLSVQGAAMDLTRAQLEAVTLPQMQQAAQAVEANARWGFYYVFDTNRVADAVLARRPLAQAHHHIFSFVNSPAFLNFARELTGDERVNYVDMQATRYRPGHFLTIHSDEREGAGRLYAYVFNFTPVWRPEWGGLLLFIDERGQVSEGFSPVFNGLNILKVPTPHCVTMVTPSAAGPRLSYTGWLRALDAPPEIPAPP